MQRANILGVMIDAVTKREALSKLLHFLKEDKYHMLFTPNPEFIMEAQKDREFMSILNKGDLVVPDGVGIVIASRLLGEKIKGRVTGCDLILSLFGAVKGKYSVYLLGGAPGVAEMAKANMEARFGLNIIGFADGFFDKQKERRIIKEIQKLKPDILLVGTGFPKQEKWIYEHRNRLPVKISAGIGGSIDIMAGTVKRAPKIMRLLGIEWLWRLLLQPRRIKRMYKLPIFLLQVLKSKNP